MRVLRLIFCALILTAVAAGQSSSTSTGTAQDPNLKPENPLQEPVKPNADAEAAKTKSSTFNVGDNTTAGQDQILGEVRLMTRNTELGGDKTRSFKTEGVNNLAEFNYYQDRRFLLTHRIQVLSMYRGTDDRSIDPEQNSVQRGYVRIYGPRDEYIFGDVLVNYSRLSLNQNLKGFSGAWKAGDNWKVSTFGGIYIDRWGSLYKDYTDTPGRTYTSGVAGARLEYNVSRGNVLGVNFSSSDDMTGSIPSTPAGTPPNPASNRVGSFDAKLQLGAVRLDGELAMSATNFDTRLNSGYESDWGLRLEGTYRHRKLSVRGSYIRYQPNFASFNARQISDLQDFVFRTGYEVTDWMTAEGTVRRSNDNLAGQLPFEHVSWGPEGRLIFHDLPFYRRAVFETGYRERISETSDKSSSRYTRMPYAELTLPYHTTFFSVGYERRQAVDEIVGAQTTNTNRFYVTLRGIYDLGGWHINPVARLELERESARPDLPLVDRLQYDSNRLSTVSLYVEAPKFFIGELAYRNNSATIYGPSGFARPSYRTALTYKVNNDENMLVIFAFERNNNFYYLPSPNFDERQYSFTLVYKFGKRGR